uniref:SURF6 domain-containing protein n=1 Tax=Caenorhabditis japonica TaxID=281687 RepID=A0A8R1DJ10_CAEJA
MGCPSIRSHLQTAKKDRALKLTGRDYKSLIAKVEETKATIAKVREADPHKATIMEDELKWEKTLKRAAGGKVKDNLEMLKKALAKKNKLKERKKEKWENREKKSDGEKQTANENRNPRQY